MKLNLIRHALWIWAKDALEGEIPEDQIIWREGSRPLPPRPCVGLKILAGPMRLGATDGLVPVSDSVVDFVGDRKLTISVQTFGFDAMQTANDLANSLSRWTVLEKLSAKGIGVGNIQGILDLAAVEETEYEDRASFEFDIFVAEIIRDDLGAIETLDDVGVNLG